MIFSRQLAKYRRDWRSFPADARLAYQNERWRGVWDAIAERTLRRVLRMGHVIVFAQPLDTAPEIAPPPGITITRVSECDWPRLSSLLTSRELERFRLLVAAGRHCLVAWRGGQPIGYAWVAESIGPDVTGCIFPLSPDAAYLWDLYVLPAERRNGIGSALAGARIQLARQLGFREGWRMIKPSNRASLRTLHKSGSQTRVVGDLRFLKLFSRMHVRFTPLPGGSKAGR